jgi:hypothetical protein
MVKKEEEEEEKDSRLQHNISWTAFCRNAANTVFNAAILYGIGATG